MTHKKSLPKEGFIVHRPAFLSLPALPPCFQAGWYEFAELTLSLILDKKTRNSKPYLIVKCKDFSTKCGISIFFPRCNAYHSIQTSRFHKFHAKMIQTEAWCLAFFYKGKQPGLQTAKDNKPSFLNIRGKAFHSDYSF